jgi:hypothetical protein
MVSEQVHPVALEVLERLHVDRHDQPAPQAAQLPLVPLDPQPHFLDVRAGLLERLDGATDHLRHPLVDREDVKVGAVGNPPAINGPPNRRCEALVGVEAKRISGVIASQRFQRERGVLDRPGDRPLE